MTEVAHLQPEERPADQPAFLRLAGITVQYPGVRALDNVDLEIRAGQCVALMGRNGAGKSTLVRIVSGVELPTAGHVEIDGNHAVLASPTAARHRGIVTVHQELTIVPGLSVAENIMLGRWPANRLGGIHKGLMRREAGRALELLGEHLDLDAVAGKLSIAHQQLIEIARGLTTDARLLILDEPTSSLTAHEAEALLKLIRRLVSAGVAVIYVSHRMNEISQVADIVTIVRDGRIVETMPVEHASVGAVTEAMVGDGYKHIDESTVVRTTPAESPVVLRADGISDGSKVTDVSMEVKRGEILGLAGLLSSGRTETLQMIAGARPIRSGRIEINGKPIRTRLSPASALKFGIALVPEDRKGEGLVLDLSVEENVAMSSLGRLATAGVIRRRRRREAALSAQQDLAIKVTDPVVEVGTLSGGNQQKVVIGRCLVAGAGIYLFDEPTRGVDIRAKHQIYDIMRSLADQGNAIIFASSEYEELLLLSSRILILNDGRSRPAPPVQRLTLDQLLAEMMKESAA